jgi:hypothetical protein
MAVFVLVYAKQNGLALELQLLRYELEKLKDTMI